MSNVNCPLLNFYWYSLDFIPNLPETSPHYVLEQLLSNVELEKTVFPLFTLTRNHCPIAC